VRVNWLRAARANLIAVSEYISQDNPEAATRTVAAIVKVIENLTLFPLPVEPEEFPEPAS
jgi:plasmid stabilization system protein ParE